MYNSKRRSQESNQDAASVKWETRPVQESAISEELRLT
jgi:hypothetical protein